MPLRRYFWCHRCFIVVIIPWQDFLSNYWSVWAYIVQLINTHGNIKARSFITHQEHATGWSDVIVFDGSTGCSSGTRKNSSLSYVIKMLPKVFMVGDKGKNTLDWWWLGTLGGSLAVFMRLGQSLCGNTARDPLSVPNHLSVVRCSCYMINGSTQAKFFHDRLSVMRALSVTCHEFTCRPWFYEIGHACSIWWHPCGW